MCIYYLLKWWVYAGKHQIYVHLLGGYRRIMENRDHEIACLAKENGDMKELHLESSAEEQLVTPAGTVLNQGAHGYWERNFIQKAGSLQGKPMKIHCFGVPKLKIPPATSSC
jgi:hypothetical protein